MVLLLKLSLILNGVFTGKVVSNLNGNAIKSFNSSNSALGGNVTNGTNQAISISTGTNITYTGCQYDNPPCIILAVNANDNPPTDNLFCGLDSPDSEPFSTLYGKTFRVGHDIVHSRNFVYRLSFSKDELDGMVSKTNDYAKRLSQKGPTYGLEIAQAVFLTDLITGKMVQKVYHALSPVH